MKHEYNRWIMGAAVGAATLAVAIDHTRHKLPEPESPDVVIIQEEGSAAPCGLEAAPCSLD